MRCADTGASTRGNFRAVSSNFEIDRFCDLNILLLFDLQLQVSSSCRRYPTLLERQVVDRRQLTGKMKSTALAIGMSGTASPRRTIVLSLAKANSVILGRR